MDVDQILLVLAAVSAGFFAKGITGIGGPMLAIPVLASFMGVEFAVAVIAIPTIVANTWLLWVNRSSAGSVRSFLRPLLIGGAIGVLAGAWILVNVNGKLLSFALAIFVIVYIIWYLTNSQFQLDERAANRLAAPVGLIGGTLQGATGISAPVIATYMHSQRLPRTEFIFAVTVPFQVLGMVQIVSMASLGVYTSERLIAGAFAILPVIIVLPIAMRLGRRFSQQAFQNIVLIILAVSAVRLLWSVFS